MCAITINCNLKIKTKHGFKEIKKPNFALLINL